ncbi:MAG: hypothetical protein L0J03_17170, partial [Brevibacterium sp.]|nr:hypothetical protein [Brevibacterium sp.]
SACRSEAMDASTTSNFVILDSSVPIKLACVGVALVVPRSSDRALHYCSPGAEMSCEIRCESEAGCRAPVV